MEKSNVEKMKDILLYAPVGALGFAKDNLPTFFNVFVSRGKRDVNKTAQQAEEKISATKEHGQIVAMGTPIAKSKAEKVAGQAKDTGENLAHFSIDVALGAINALDSIVRSVTSSIVSTDSNSPQSPTPHPTNLSGAASTPAASSAKVEQPPVDSPPVVIDKNGPTFVPSEFVRGEGDFIAEPVDQDLPAKIRAQYPILSAPEIIDRLDEFTTDELRVILRYETDFRNRQTIVHAINHRLANIN